MTYTPNVPQAGQRIAFTQPIIENNFTYIDTAMKVDHAWNGNEIDSQADGTHKKISLPNQAADIVALPLGIKSIMYAKGGNIYAWNGTKNAISGGVQTGTLNLTSTNQTIITLPSDCIGFIGISIKEGLLTNAILNYPFFTIAGVGYVGSFTPPAGSVTTVILSFVIPPSPPSTDLLAKVQASPANNYTATYKLIYWPL